MLVVLVIIVIRYEDISTPDYKATHIWHQILCSIDSTSICSMHSVLMIPSAKLFNLQFAFLTKKSFDCVGTTCHCEACSGGSEREDTTTISLCAATILAPSATGIYIHQPKYLKLFSTSNGYFCPSDTEFFSLCSSGVRYSSYLWGTRYKYTVWRSFNIASTLQSFSVWTVCYLRESIYTYWNTYSGLYSSWFTFLLLHRHKLRGASLSDWVYLFQWHKE